MTIVLDEVACQRCWYDGYLTGISAGAELIETSVTNTQESTGDEPTVENYLAAIRLVREWLKKQDEIAEIEKVSLLLAKHTERVQ